MYMPKLARFTSRDPLANDGATLLGGFSHYAYVENNPANLTDPSGLAVTLAVCEKGLMGAMGGGGVARRFVVVSRPPATPQIACPPSTQFVRWQPLKGDEATLAAICKNLQCKNCTRAGCEKVVADLIGAARSTYVWPLWMERCQAWAFAFEKRINPIIFHPCVSGNGINRVNIRRYGGLTTGHVIYFVTFCDGTTVYFDGPSAFGGQDNIFFVGDPKIPGDVTIE